MQRGASLGLNIRVLQDYFNRDSGSQPHSFAEKNNRCLKWVYGEKTFPLYAACYRLLLLLLLLLLAIRK
jgi:hypothetical protein